MLNFIVLNSHFFIEENKGRAKQLWIWRIRWLIGFKHFKQQRRQPDINLASSQESNPFFKPDRSEEQKNSEIKLVWITSQNLQWELRELTSRRPPVQSFQIISNNILKNLKVKIHFWIRAIADYLDEIK